MIINAIVLDIGGVVLRTEDRSGRQALEEKYGLPPGGVDALVFGSQAAAESSIGKLGPEKIWQNVADTLSLSPDALSDFQKIFWQGDQIDQELISFLESLRSKYVTAFLTNAWLDTRQILANHFAIVEGKTIDHLLISSELGMVKPDPCIFQRLSETINTQFDDILFVDDFIENIAAAAALGIHTIHYKAGMDLIAQIKHRVNQL
jgi:HAD superfamily hydrolase (TIGR01509 family)